MKENKILVVGSCNTDMVIKTARFPLPGETIIGGEFLMNQGGKGANQALAAKRLGGDVIFVGKIGEDVFGQNSFELMKSEGIDVRYLERDDSCPSGVALITVEASGENSIVVAPGSNDRLLASDFDKTLSELDEVAIIVIQLEIPLKTVEHVITVAVERKKRVILNPAPAGKLSDMLLRQVSVLTPNETEAETLTGIKVHNIDSAKKAAKILQQKGVEDVIITMGALGAYVHSKSFKGLVNAPKVEVSDTTAAGDTFNGALAVALAENKPMRDAVEFACKVAAISVTRHGAQASMPYKHELNKIN